MRKLRASRARLFRSGQALAQSSLSRVRGPPRRRTRQVQVTVDLVQGTRKRGRRDKTFRIAESRRKVSWTKCFAAGGRSVWGRVGRGSGEGAVGVNGVAGRRRGFSRCAQHEDSRARVGCRTRLKRVAVGVRRGGFGSAARRGYGPPQRGYSASSRVRTLPQQGHRGRSGSSSWGSAQPGSVPWVGWPKALKRSTSLRGFVVSGRVSRISSTHARWDRLRFDGCQSP